MSTIKKNKGKKTFQQDYYSPLIDGVSVSIFGFEFLFLFFDKKNCQFRNVSFFSGLFSIQNKIIICNSCQSFAFVCLLYNNYHLNSDEQNISYNDSQIKEFHFFSLENQKAILFSLTLCLLVRLLSLKLSKQKQQQ